MILKMEETTLVLEFGADLISAGQSVRDEVNLVDA